MNQKQREYLIEELRKSYSNKLVTLENQLVKTPSLNNYLISAIMNDSVVIKQEQSIRKFLKILVNSLTQGELLIKTRNDFSSFSKFNKLHSFECCLIPVTELFELPDEYVKALDAVTSYNDKIRKKMDEIKEKRDNALLKIAVGTDESLRNIIDEASSISLTSILSELHDDKRLLPAEAQLFLTNGE